MSSTERAPEPTMEEILASIRRIITDDEAGQARAQKTAPRAQTEDESLEGEADSQIIDDIARVLSGSAAQTPAEEEEEILDLTAELGGLELVEDEGAVEEEVVEITEVTEIAEVIELEELEAAEPAEGEAESPPVAEEVSAPVFRSAPEMAPPPRMTAPQPETPAPAPEPVQPELKPTASQEAASALERAIAALRAGQVPTSTTPQAEPFRFQTAPQPGPMPAGPQVTPFPMAVPMPEPEPEAETHPEPESYFAPEPVPPFEAEPEGAPAFELMDEGGQEAELVLSEDEMTEAIQPEESAAMEADQPEDEAAPFWPSEVPAWQSEEPEPEPEPEPVAAQVNGGAHHDAVGKTLEDSIKDMLRPMLRQWLDENMPRLVREMDPQALRRSLD